MAVWNTSFEASPAGADDPSLGDDKFRELKQAVRERLIKEHTMNTGSGLLAEDGWHRMGSGMIYIGEAAPTTKPDGATALDSTYDVGRLWLKVSTGQISYWTGTAWANVFVNGLYIGGRVAINSSGYATWG